MALALVRSCLQEHNRVGCVKTLIERVSTPVRPQIDVGLSALSLTGHRQRAYGVPDRGLLSARQTSTVAVCCRGVPCNSVAAADLDQSKDPAEKTGKSKQGRRTEKNTVERNM